MTFDFSTRLTMFENHLNKMFKHNNKPTRKQDITCFRFYLYNRPGYGFLYRYQWQCWFMVLGFRRWNYQHRSASRSYLCAGWILCGLPRGIWQLRCRFFVWNHWHHFYRSYFFSRQFIFIKRFPESHDGIRNHSIFSHRKWHGENWSAWSDRKKN